MQKRFRWVWLLPFAALLLVPCLILFLLWEDYRPKPAVPDSPPHQILSSDADLRMLARLDLCIAGAVNDRTLLALDHQVLYLHSDGTPKGPYVRLQDINAHSPIWQSSGTHYPFSMAVINDALFLTTSTEVQAYSLVSGELLWRNEVLPGHTGNVITPKGLPGLTIYYTLDNPLQRSAVIITLDTQSGTSIETLEFPLQEFALMAPYTRDEVLWMSGQDLWLSATPTGPELWHVHTRGRIAEWPLEYGSTLIVSTGFFPTIVAIDLDTGDILWEDLRQFVSLPVTFGGLIYAVTTDAELVALDPTTGRERGSVQFSPLTPEEGSRSYYYTLTATNQILAVYFGDSCQLFVLGGPAA